MYIFVEKLNENPFVFIEVVSDNVVRMLSGNAMVK